MLVAGKRQVVYSGNILGNTKSVIEETRISSELLNSMKFSRASSLVKILQFSDVSGANSVPIFRVVGSNWTARYPATNCYLAP